jgi:beta-galactosidase
VSSRSRFPPIARNFPHLLHGGDYNPEQWLDTPEVWDEDVRLLELANCNTWTVGVFSWAMLEPSEGEYEFRWLDTVLGKMADNGIRLVLATPGGAKPAWMAKAYPETLRVLPDRRRMLWGGRHNHCMTSPAFRTKAAAISEQLASRYGEHPTLALWHVNNEYSGECYCDLCENAFREWLKKRYDNDLDKLNRAYWSAFWSHAYRDWEEVEAPSPIGVRRMHALNLDWKRYTTDQTIDCFRAESEPLRRLTPNVPITVNMMPLYSDIDYAKFGRSVDVISWDTYPEYHDRETDWKSACLTSFVHAQRRAMKQRPFIVMESAPGQQNYKAVCKQKRPGVHELEAMQTIGHGSDSVLYFQWRKSRGSVEKFHGAVVDHYATPDNRIFREVAQVGADLEKLEAVVGTDTPVHVAVIYDYENHWAVDDTAGPRNGDKQYPQTCIEHFRAFWHNGVSCDVVDDQADLGRYKLLIAPMLYMLKPGIAEKIEQFVAAGGTFVTTYFSGIVDETDLCFRTGFPGPLRKLMGIWSEETDALYDDEKVRVTNAKTKKHYDGGWLCDIVHLEGAEAVAIYASEFYAGSPAVTVNRFGEGEAYYLACRLGDDFNDDFYGRLIDELGLHRNLGVALPQGVTAQRRTDGEREWIFVLSFVKQPHEISLGERCYSDALSGERLAGTLKLPGYGYRVLVARLEGGSE